MLAECDVRRTRRSGPGGQHRNKVETAIVLRHRPTGATAEAAERRSQRENHKLAVFRLRLRLALEHRSAPSQPPSPSDLWRSRCRAGRISINPDHEDLPALLAEALDRIALHGTDVKAAAAALGCSATQLVKLLKLAPPALERVNHARAEHGLPPLR